MLISSTLNFVSLSIFNMKNESCLVRYDNTWILYRCMMNDATCVDRTPYSVVVAVVGMSRLICTVIEIKTF